MATFRRGSKDKKPRRPSQSALFKRKKFCRFTAENVGRLVQNRPALVACTDIDRKVDLTS